MFQNDKKSYIIAAITLIITVMLVIFMLNALGLRDFDKKIFHIIE